MTTETQVIDRPDNARIHAEAVGEPADPPLLLIGGATWSLDWWDDGLCELLVRQGIRVLRYDPRDAGESTTYPVGEPGYDAADLLADSIAVADAFGAERVNVAGLSMGGGIAQALGLAHRDRVGSLTLIATSPIEAGIEGLPGPDPALFADPPPEPDWTDRAAAIERLVEDERPYAGPGSFDEERTRAIAGRAYDRSHDIAARTNHFMVAESGGAPHLADLAGIPTLVVHGDADPMLPLEHGRALARAIPGAELMVVENMGHQLPPRASWPRLVDAIAEIATPA